MPTHVLASTPDDEMAQILVVHVTDGHRERGKHHVSTSSPEESFR